MQKSSLELIMKLLFVFAFLGGALLYKPADTPPTKTGLVSLHTSAPMRFFGGWRF